MIRRGIISYVKEKRNEFKRKGFREILKERYGEHICYGCGKDRIVEYHHIVPLELGGTNLITNIVPLCYNCHLAAHRKNNNLGLENRKLAGGRPIRHLPEGYENIIEDYLYGRYGYKKCKELLGFTKGMKLTESVEFVQYLERKGVKDYKNTYDVVFCKKNRVNPVDPNKVVAWIEFDNGIMYKMRASGSHETLLVSTNDKI